MFDMNKLWESFIYASVRKHKLSTSISSQSSKYFWKQENHSRTTIRPDIVINKDDENNCVVLDTKWKNILTNNPSPEDLRQMYVYHEYFKAKKVALIYPGVEFKSVKGKFLDREFDMECSVVTLPVERKISDWQENICKEIQSWINHN